MSYSPPPAYQGSDAANSTGGEPPLNQPYYGASIGAAIRRFFTKYATFRGRASRSEFWWWELVAAIVGIVYNVLNVATRSSDPNHPYTAGGILVLIVYGIFALGTLIPSLAVTWRRMHDTNRSGAWYFIAFIPIIGTIIFIVFAAGASKPEGQRFDR